MLAFPPPSAPPPHFLPPCFATVCSPPQLSFLVSPPFVRPAVFLPLFVYIRSPPLLITLPICSPPPTISIRLLAPLSLPLAPSSYLHTFTHFSPLLLILHTFAHPFPLLFPLLPALCSPPTCLTPSPYLHKFTRILLTQPPSLSPVPPPFSSPPHFPPPRFVYLCPPLLLPLLPLSATCSPPTYTPLPLSDRHLPVFTNVRVLPASSPSLLCSPVPLSPSTLPLLPSSFLSSSCSPPPPPYLHASAWPPPPIRIHSLAPSSTFNF